MTKQNRTVLFDQHAQLGATMVNFGGWEMPMQYPAGILHEHMATREQAGLFDVSHMGRLFFAGPGSLAFLQHVLTNNAASLSVGCSQYTIIPNEQGGAVDDCYLYRFTEEGYLLVVNAANREKDIAYLQKIMRDFPEVTMTDKTTSMAMISLQGPRSQQIMAAIFGQHSLPKARRNALSIARYQNKPVLLARTGYTGEPLCFEFFMANEQAALLWKKCLELGAVPIGLGARDTLRLEACLPLYGHEMGVDDNGFDIPVFASNLAKFAVSFSSDKGDFIGRKALRLQYAARTRIEQHDYSDTSALPKIIMPLAITGKGIARAGYTVLLRDRIIGHITSGTSVPHRPENDTAAETASAPPVKSRPIALALLDATVQKDDVVDIQIRKKLCLARIVPQHIR